MPNSEQIIIIKRGYVTISYSCSETNRLKNENCNGNISLFFKYPHALVHHLGVFAANPWSTGQWYTLQASGAQWLCTVEVLHNSFTSIIDVRANEKAQLWHISCIWGPVRGNPRARRMTERLKGATSKEDIYHNQNATVSACFIQGKENWIQKSFFWGGV